MRLSIGQDRRRFFHTVAGAGFTGIAAQVSRVWLPSGCHAFSVRTALEPSHN